MIQDLHSHTYYSFCGEDSPETIVEAAIASKIDVFGICDHNYGIGCARIGLLGLDIPKESQGLERTLRRYLDHINLIKEKYAGQIEIKRGIELCTVPLPNHILPDGSDISYYDYCLIEHVDRPDSVTGRDLFSYAAKWNCLCGVAHTDLFAHIKNLGQDPLEYFSKMAEQNIFWEMNVNYDSIHSYNEHKYVKEFFSDSEQQEIIKKSGVRLSVGFDGHRVKDYAPQRVHDACQRINDLGIKLVFED